MNSLAKKSYLKTPGFFFSGISAGIKIPAKSDLALIYSEVPAKAVGVFTSNRLKAAPVLQGQAAIKNGRLQAVLANSGNANAATGALGLKNAQRSAQEVAKLLKISKDDVLVSSTGRIGVQLPFEKIKAALPQAVKRLSADSLSEAATAIMTTDKFSKICQRQLKIQGKTVTITGLAKGAGMIEPHMATMLAYILTDIDAPLPILRSVFRASIAESFNAITVDGDCSTNDTALLLANGQSGVTLPKNSPEMLKFQKVLTEVCQTLSKMMVQDGEGATKTVEIVVEGARSVAQAQKIAYSVARSQLVKTSFFGEDPNWGRVFAAVGYSGQNFDPQKVDIYYGAVALVKNGSPCAEKNRQLAHQVMKAPEFKVTIRLKLGNAKARIWTSDLNYDYIKINAEYS